MIDILIIFHLIAFLWLIIGLVKPSFVLIWGAKKSRIRVLIIYGIIFITLIILGLGSLALEVTLLLLHLVAFLWLIIGLIKPDWVIRWGSKKTRSRVLLIYSLTFLILVMFGKLFTSTPTIDSSLSTKDIGSEQVQEDGSILSKQQTKNEINVKNVWQKIYGDYEDEEAYYIQQTKDGGYIIAGSCEKYGRGTDILVIKLNSYGNIEWEKTFGGKNNDKAYSIQQTFDDGYIIVGEINQQFTPLRGGDLVLIKIDSKGNLLWQKTFGGDDFDEATSVKCTKDGGYIVAGWTSSFGNSGSDCYVIKVDKNGKVLWQKTYGGNSDDEAWDICESEDGGYVIVGRTISFGAKLWDLYVIKIDNKGNVLWEKLYGGNGDDWGKSIQPTKDGGYIIAGRSNSSNDKYKYDEIYILKIDSKGKFQWQKFYGGKYLDWANSIKVTPDDNYIVTGVIDYYQTQDYKIKSDIFVLKLNSKGNIIWYKKFGKEGEDFANSIENTKDGGYIIAGYTNSFSKFTVDHDIYIIKTDKDGRSGQYPKFKE